MSVHGDFDGESGGDFALSLEEQEEISRSGAGGLIAAIMAKNAADSAHMSNILMDSYRDRAEQAEARLTIIRMRIGFLLDQDFMPHPRRLMSALHPGIAEVEECAESARTGSEWSIAEYLYHFPM